MTGKIKRKLKAMFATRDIYTKYDKLHPVLFIQLIVLPPPTVFTWLPRVFYFSQPLPQVYAPPWEGIDPRCFQQSRQSKLSHRSANLPGREPTDHLRSRILKQSPHWEGGSLTYLNSDVKWIPTDSRILTLPWACESKWEGFCKPT